MFIILASDGLWDTFSNEEACTFIKQRIREPDFGAKSLAMESYYRGSVDNITVLVIVFRPGCYTIGTDTKSNNSLKNSGSSSGEDNFNLKISSQESRFNYDNYNENGPRDSKSSIPEHNGEIISSSGTNLPKMSAASIIASTNLNRSNSFRAK